MAQSRATGLIMPMPNQGQGYYKRPQHSAQTIGYDPVWAGTTLLQPGRPTDDTATFQPDPDDQDEMMTSVEVGVIAIPHFPQMAGPYAAAHAHELRPRYLYHQQASKHITVILPTPIEDPPADAGIPDEFGAEAVSVMASTSVRDAGNRRGVDMVSEAAKTNDAHRANEDMGENEQTVTGATGVWAIAGPAPA